MWENMDPGSRSDGRGGQWGKMVHQNVWESE
jgi:hypothetical protein